MLAFVRSFRFCMTLVFTVSCASEVLGIPNIAPPLFLFTMVVVVVVSVFAYGIYLKPLASPLSDED